MTTHHVKIEGVLADVGIERAGDCEVVGASANGDGSVTVSIRDLVGSTHGTEGDDGR